MEREGNSSDVGCTMFNVFRKKPSTFDNELAEKSAHQELALYWDPDFAHVLETWGEDNAWIEIQFLLATAKGNVLDIACGTGKVMAILSRFTDLKVHGFDISDFLIEKAVDRGISPDCLSVCDATKVKYMSKTFDYSYSIGSLEHFTEVGIQQALAEANRVTKSYSFHQIPISRDQDQGWIAPCQAYFNNTLSWWLPKFELEFAKVTPINSRWNDERSIGYWFVCQCK